MKELFNYNSHFKDYIMRATEVLKLLNFLNIVWSPLYFDEDALTETIIFDLQWFDDAFKGIIEFKISEKGIGDIEYRDLQLTGELDDDKRVTVWDNFQVEGFLIINRNIILYWTLRIISNITFGAVWEFYLVLRSKHDLKILYSI